MVNLIVVEPFAHGWAVSQAAADNAQLFASGARAEDAAKFLGARLAEAGQATEIRVYLRDGALGGRFLCPTP
ncbi:MAG TPA: hypothetical protein VIC25_00210 [Caulobacteraceae bacterium]